MESPLCAVIQMSWGYVDGICDEFPPKGPEPKVILIAVNLNVADSIDRILSVCPEDGSNHKQLRAGPLRSWRLEEPDGGQTFIDLIHARRMAGAGVVAGRAAAMGLLREARIAFSIPTSSQQLGPKASRPISARLTSEITRAD